jgi:hypothetical protein
MSFNCESESRIRLVRTYLNGVPSRGVSIGSQYLQIAWMTRVSSRKITDGLPWLPSEMVAGSSSGMGTRNAIFLFSLMVRKAMRRLVLHGPRHLPCIHQCSPDAYPTPRRRDATARQQGVYIYCLEE